jgi:hypothetical protein
MMLLSLLLSISGPASSSSVLQTSFDDLCLGADLIVQGRVIAVDARADTATPFIWTDVTVEAIEVIHGKLDAGHITLSFLGGSAGGRRLQVANMVVPQIGEQGIYFVEARARRQVHPLLGWQQGHFRVESGPDGMERVIAAGRRVVSGISPSMLPKQRGLSTGIAAGVQVLGAGEDAAGAMRPTEFKAAIVETLTRRGAPSR